MSERFRHNDRHTLGVELELQLLDAETMLLKPAMQQILPLVPEKWKEKIKPEFMQSYCEINTGICETVPEVERDLTEKLQWCAGVADDLGLLLGWGGTHPVSRWDEQKITPGERYAWLQEVMQDVARRMAVFGLHVHVGLDSGDKAIQLCDRLLKHLPTMLALSASSPMWCGRETGMASYRSKIIEALPTAGLPHTMRNWSEYNWLIDLLMATKFIHTRREIWWDVRPHAGFGTVEIRIMDMPINFKHTLALTALCQSLVAGIAERIDHGAYLYDCHPMIAKQNKWQAGRYGMDAEFVDPDTMKAVPARQAARRLIEICAPVAEKLGCLAHLNDLNDIIDHGTGAQRLMQAWKRSGDMKAMVQQMVDANFAGRGVAAGRVGSGAPINTGAGAQVAVPAR